MTFIVVTCTTYEKFTNDKGEEKVKFDGLDDTSTTAVFLEGLEKKAKTEYHASLITEKQAAKKIHEKIEKLCNEGQGNAKKLIPLFVVHGYSNEPNHVIDEVIANREKFNGSSHFPVFVIWPCTGWFNGSFHGYNKDSDEQAPDSGAAFFKFVNDIDDKIFSRKSLMMHSMGNHVAFNGACRLGAPKVQFENIFMVAADVPHDVFHKDPVENYSNSKGEGELSNKEIWGNKIMKANNFYQMLAKDASGTKPKGKVVVLYNGRDKALAVSSWVMNSERRIGQRGMGTKTYLTGIYYEPEKHLLPKFLHCHSNEDCNKFTGWVDSGHGYQFEKGAIEVYEKYALAGAPFKKPED